VVAVTTLIPYNFFVARMEQETEKIEHYATKTEAALQRVLKPNQP